MPKTILCKAHQETILVRNIAARGLMRTFTLSASKDTGTVIVTHSIFPFFVLKRTKTLPVHSGMQIKRGFFDASFQLSIRVEEDIKMTLS